MADEKQFATACNYDPRYTMPNSYEFTVWVYDAKFIIYINSQMQAGITLYRITFRTGL